MYLNYYFLKRENENKKYQALALKLYNNLFN